MTGSGCVFCGFSGGRLEGGTFQTGVSSGGSGKVSCSCDACCFYLLGPLHKCEIIFINISPNLSCFTAVGTCAIFVVLFNSAQGTSVQQKSSAPVKEVKDEDDDDDDDDIDLFGSDEDEEAEKIKEQRLKDYAERKAKKPALIAKSSILLDVKPVSLHHHYVL